MLLSFRHLEETYCLHLQGYLTGSGGYCSNKVEKLCHFYGTVERVWPIITTEGGSGNGNFQVQPPSEGSQTTIKQTKT